jgi:hypothetical protein
MSTTLARTRLAGLPFTLNSSKQAARCLHSSSRRQAEANEALGKTNSTDMQEHLDNIEQMHLRYKLHGEMDFSGADVGELDVHLHPRWRQLPPTGIRGAWNWLRDRYHNGYKNYYACVWFYVGRIQLLTLSLGLAGCTSWRNGTVSLTSLSPRSSLGLARPSTFLDQHSTSRCSTNASHNINSFRRL